MAPEKEGIAMVQVSLPILAAWADAGLMTVAGVANLWNLRPLRTLYADLDIPQPFYLAIGLIQILAASFLASPEMRVYGILLAAPILFGSVVMLLNHRYYAIAAPIMAMMVALVAATLAAAPVHSRYTVELSPPSISEPASILETVSLASVSVSHS
jgi:hypothetical protein